MAELRQAPVPGPPRVPRSMLRTVGTTSAAKVAVMAVSGLLGLLTSRLIISHFGTDTYAQYGLLSSFPALLPFADLGMAAILINAVAGAQDARTDGYVRSAITTALRILLVAGVVILALAALVTALGWWPWLLGRGLTAGGATAAFVCLAVFALVLPLTIGPRLLVGLHRTGTQVACQLVVAPFLFTMVSLAVATAAPVGDYLAVLSYLASGLVAVLALAIAGHHLRPQLGRAIRDVPHPRRAPSLPALNLAWPMLVQMIALPIAMQTDRLLLSHRTDGTELAQYHLASQLFGLVLQAIMAGGMALWPIYAKARAEADLRSPYRPAAVFAVLGLALAGGLALLAPWVTGFVSAGAIVLDPWLIGGFVVFVGLQAAKYPLGMYMTDYRGLRFQVLPIVVMVPLNLGISWWLIGVAGPGGPIIGSAVTVLLCQVLPNFAYVSRDLKRRAQATGDPPAATGDVSGPARAEDPAR